MLTDGGNREEKSRRKSEVAKCLELDGSTSSRVFEDFENVRERKEMFEDKRKEFDNERKCSANSQGRKGRRVSPYTFHMSKRRLPTTRSIGKMHPTSSKQSLLD